MKKPILVVMAAGMGLSLIHIYVLQQHVALEAEAGQRVGRRSRHQHDQGAGDRGINEGVHKEPAHLLRFPGIGVVLPMEAGSELKQLAAQYLAAGRKRGQHDPAHQHYSEPVSYTHLLFPKSKKALHLPGVIS